MEAKEFNELLRTKLIRTVIGLQIEKGLDYDSFIFGLKVALTDTVLGKWIAAAFNLDTDDAERLRGHSYQLAASLREMLEIPLEWEPDADK